MAGGGGLVEEGGKRGKKNISFQKHSIFPSNDLNTFN